MVAGCGMMCAWVGERAERCTWPECGASTRARSTSRCCCASRTGKTARSGTARWPRSRPCHPRPSRPWSVPSRVRRWYRQSRSSASCAACPTATSRRSSRCSGAWACRGCWTDDHHAAVTSRPRSSWRASWPRPRSWPRRVASGPRPSRPSSTSSVLPRTSSTTRSTGCLSASRPSSGPWHDATSLPAASCCSMSAPPGSKAAAVRSRPTATAATTDPTVPRSCSACSPMARAAPSRWRPSAATPRIPPPSRPSSTSCATPSGSPTSCWWVTGACSRVPASSASPRSAASAGSARHPGAGQRGSPAALALRRARPRRDRQPRLPR